MFLAGLMETLPLETETTCWRNPQAPGRDKNELSLKESVHNPVPLEFLQIQPI